MTNGIVFLNKQKKINFINLQFRLLGNYYNSYVCKVESTFYIDTMIASAPMHSIIAGTRFQVESTRMDQTNKSNSIHSLLILSLEMQRDYEETIGYYISSMRAW